MKTMIAALAGAALLGSAATAAYELQLDVNSVSAQAYDANNVAGFGGLAHTGTIVLSQTASSTLAGILFDGAAQTIAAGQLATFSGVINLNAGMVTGGTLNMTLNNTDTFTATIYGDAMSMIVFQAGQGFSLSGLLTSAFFGGPNPGDFAGISIAPWYSNQPLDGSFINFSFNPDGTGLDINTNVDIFLVVPSPLAGGMAGVGLMGLAARRRRA
jgi:hypothetical protein